MEKLIDLHTHTVYSDGDLTPSELLDKAIEKNIGTISITDHDTILAYDECLDATDINIIPGIELSAKSSIGSMHILGYGIDIHNTSLKNKMSELRNNSIYSILAVLTQLKKDYGISFDNDKITDLIVTNRSIGKLDVAKLIVQQGLATSVPNAFEKYLNEVKANTRSTARGISYEECIDLISGAGGIPVLAHPHTLELNPHDFLIRLKKLISAGLMGIEVYHNSHSKEDVEWFMKIADEFELLYSGGSDYHGETAKPDVELGTGLNENIKIKRLTLIEQLKKSNKC